MGLLDSIIFGVALGVSGAFDKDKKQIKQLRMVQPWEQALVLAENGLWQIPLD